MNPERPDRITPLYDQEANITAPWSFAPGDPDGPPLEVLPPGMVWGRAADGARIPAYRDDEPAAPVVEAAAQPIPAWAKTTALLMITGSGSTALGAWGLSYAAHSLEAIAHALEALAVIAACIALAVLAVARSRRSTARQTTHITQHVTATGLFGRAKGGSITHIS